MTIHVTYILTCMHTCIQTNVHTDNRCNHATQSACMHMYIVPIAIFAQSILVVSGDIVLLSDMDAQMQQEESSSEETYEELEDLVSHVCGQVFGDKVKKLRSYKSQFKKIKDQQKETKKLLHHWKDKCLGTRAELSQLEDAHQSVRSELMALQAEHEQIGNWLSHSTDPNQKLEELGLKISKLKSQSLRSQEDEVLMSQSLRMQSELSDEPQFKRSKVGATFSAHPQQPKAAPPAQLFAIGATLPKTTKVKTPMFDEPWHEGKF